jgi:flagellin
VAALSNDAQITLTDAGGDSASITIAAGTTSMDDIVSQLNSDLSATNVDVSASLSEDGNLVFAAANAGENFVVSGTNATFQDAFGVSDQSVEAASSSETAEMEGENSEEVVSDGVTFSGQLQFEVTGSSVVPAMVNVGGANVALTKFQLLNDINSQLSRLDVRASFDEDKLSFESLAVGRDSKVGIRDVSTGSASLESTLKVSDQSRTGTGSSSFSVNVINNNLTFQTGANQNQNNQFSFGSFTSKAMNINDIDFSTAEGRNSFLGRLDDAAEQVSSSRSYIGSQQNGLTSRLNSLGEAFNQSTSSASVIRDADMAKEAMEFNRFQMLQKAGVSMAMQSQLANQQLMNLLL